MYKEMHFQLWIKCLISRKISWETLCMHNHRIKRSNQRYREQKLVYSFRLNHFPNVHSLPIETQNHLFGLHLSLGNETSICSYDNCWWENVEFSRRYRARINKAMAKNQPTFGLDCVRCAGKKGHLRRLKRRSCIPIHTRQSICTRQQRWSSLFGTDFPPFVSTNRDAIVHIYDILERLFS